MRFALRICTREQLWMGIVVAMTNVGVLLELGAEGVSADVVRAMHWYERAIVDGGHGGAMYNPSCPL